MHREQQGRCQPHPPPSAPPGNPAHTTQQGTLQKESLSPPPEHFCPVFKELWEEEGVGSRQNSATTHSRLGRTHIHPEASLYA